MDESNGKYKIMAMAIFLGLCCILTIYFHSIARLGTVFTHFFYIPIILAALWWRRKGFVVATLSERIAKAQEKAAHLNAVLHAIRNVNQLIAKENDRDLMIQRACDNLVETRGYHSAWIVLMDENGKFLTAADAGLNDNFSTVTEMMKRGEFTRCGQNALKEPGVKVRGIAAECADCPLMSSHNNGTGMAIRMEYGAQVYGILCVSVPTEMAADAVEQLLFNELAGDIAFGLHRIELENARDKAEEALRKLNEELESEVEARTEELVKERDYTRHLIESSPDFQMTLDKNGKIKDVNEAFEKIFSKNRRDLIGTSIYEYLPKETTEKAIAQIFEMHKVWNIELTADRPEGEGGELAIFVKSKDKEAKAGVVVSFGDTGVGIPEENMKKLFEPLFTTKARGIGLGLLICKNLVEANEGGIEVQSEVGKGTTVSVFLPLSSMMVTAMED